MNVTVSDEPTRLSEYLTEEQTCMRWRLLKLNWPYGLGEHIIAEQNLTLFIRKMINMMLPRSRELRDQLAAYGDSISSQSMIAERGIE